MVQAPAQEWLTPTQFLARLQGQLGRNSLYERLKDKTIPSVRIGRKLLIPGDALDRILATGDRSRW